jgi:hypothetical protein
MVRRSQLRKKLKKLLPVVTYALTTAPFAVWAPHASAFFPPVWGSGPPVVAPPASPPPIIVVPPVSPPPFVPPPPPPVIVAPPSPPPPIVVVPPSAPSGVPEPATLVSSLIGLAAAAGYGLKRRLDRKKDEPKAE